MPPLVVQLDPFALNDAPLSGPKTCWAVVTKSGPLHGEVVEPTAPQRAAVSTATFSRLSAHRSQPVCMMPNKNTTTGSDSSENSTTEPPRLSRKSFCMLQNPNRAGGYDRH